MARKIGGVVVLDGTTVKWGTIASIVVGAPMYALAVGYVKNLRTLLSGFEVAASGVLGWAATFVSNPLNYAATGFRLAQTSFTREVGAFGIASFLVAVIVAIATSWIVLVGVTRVLR